MKTTGRSPHADAHTPPSPSGAGEPFPGVVHDPDRCGTAVSIGPPRHDPGGADGVARDPRRGGIVGTAAGFGGLPGDPRAMIFRGESDRDAAGAPWMLRVHQ